MNAVVHAESSDVIVARIHVIVVVCVKSRCGLRCKNVIAAFFLIVRS